MIGLMLVIIIWLLVMLTSVGYYSRPITRRDSRRERIPVYHSEDISDELVDHIAVTHNERKDWKVQNRLDNEIDKPTIHKKPMFWHQLILKLKTLRQPHWMSTPKGNTRAFTKPLFLRKLEFQGYNHFKEFRVVSVFLMGVCVALTIMFIWQYHSVYGLAFLIPIVFGLGNVSMPQIYVVQSDDLSAEVTAAVALGAKEIHIDPTYTYTVSSAITDDLSGITIDGHGATVQNGVGDNGIFEVTGTVSGATALNANAIINENTIRAATPTGESADEYIKLYSDAVSPGGHSVKIGEIHQIESVVVNNPAGSDTITLKEYLMYGYTMANNASYIVVTPKSNIHFKNIHFVGADGDSSSWGIKLDYCKDATIDKCTFTNLGYSGILLTDCINVKNSRCDFYYAKHSDDQHYGIAILDATRNVINTGCYFYYMRHGVTHGYSGKLIGISSQTITDSCQFVASTRAAFDTHFETGLQTQISNSVFDGNITAIYVTASYSNIINNTIIHTGTDSTHPAIEMVAYSDSTPITNINCNNNILTNPLSDPAAVAFYGIQATNAFDININANYVNGFNRGIISYFNKRFEITNNIVTGGAFGIVCSGFTGGLNYHSGQIAHNYVYDMSNNAISVDYGDHIQIKENFIFECDGNGINLLHASDTAAYSEIVGNHLHNIKKHGISVTRHDYTSITNNYIVDCDDDDSDTYSAIVLIDSDSCIVDKNKTFRTDGNKQIYGLSIDANCSNTRVYINLLSGKTSSLIDSGTDTKLPTHEIRFFRAASGATETDHGIEVDAGSEYTVAIGHMPEHCQEVVSVEVVAKSNATNAAGGMQAAITIKAGGYNEAYNTISDGPTNSTSVDTNIAADDVIHWSRSSATVSGITGNDRVEVIAEYVAGGGDNIATDADFTVAFIRYV